MGATDGRTDAVWEVYFETHGPLLEVTLGYRRRLPDGSSVAFDADPRPTLDLAADEDERLVLDGVLALLPPDALLSCALRENSRWLLIWTKPDVEHIFAEHDQAIVRRAFDGRLYNPEGSIDALLIGGERAAHATGEVKRWAAAIEKDILPSAGAERVAAWQTVLNAYQAVIYTQTTEIHLLTRAGSAAAVQARPALAAVAARYGLRLPEPDLEGVRR